MFWLAKLADARPDEARRFPVVRARRRAGGGVVELQPHDEARDKVFGQLSRRGELQLRALGERLRQRYGGTLVSEDLLPFCRSTDFSRTQLSARAVLAALLGPDATHDPVPVRVESLDRDPLQPWTPRLFEMMRRFRETNEAIKSHAREPHVEAARKALVEHLAHFRASAKNFSWVSASDFFVSRASHADAAPVPALEEHRRVVLDAAAFRFANLYRHPPLLQTISAPLLRAIAEFLESRAGVEGGDGSTPPPPKSGRAPLVDCRRARLAVLSAHDQTILPLLFSLGVEDQLVATTTSSSPNEPTSLFDALWPPFAACLAFELYEDVDVPADSPKRFRVRVVYDDGKSLRVLCARGFTADAAPATKPSPFWWWGAHTSSAVGSTVPLASFVAQARAWHDDLVRQEQAEDDDHEGSSSSSPSSGAGAAVARSPPAKL